MKSDEITLNGQDLEKGEAVLKTGQKFTIAGKLPMPEALIPNHTGPATRMLLAGDRPAVTKEEDWVDADPLREWVGPAQDQTEFESEVKMPPGDYDLRAYHLVHPFGVDLPTEYLLTSGKVRITE